MIVLVVAFCAILSTGAERCYMCLEKCEVPLRVQQCRDYGISSDMEVKCFTIQVSTDQGTFVEKGCLPAGVGDRECAKFGSVSGVQCSVCSDDLCNSSKIEKSVMILFFLMFIIAVLV